MMNKYLTVAEQSKIVRDELKKELGVTARQVSVKGSYVGYDSEISVKIKDLKVNIDDVTRIANRQSEVDYCQASGEVLQGGNNYVRVTIDSDAINKKLEASADKAKALYDQHQNLEFDCGAFLYEGEKLEAIYFRETGHDYGYIQINYKNKARDTKRYYADTLRSFGQSVILIQNQLNIELI